MYIYRKLSLVYQYMKNKEKVRKNEYNNNKLIFEHNFK